MTGKNTSIEEYWESLMIKLKLIPSEIQAIRITCMRTCTGSGDFLKLAATAPLELLLDVGRFPYV